MPRNHSIDTLRTLATVMVLFLHVSSNYVDAGLITNTLGFDFWFANFVDSFCRVSVPLFVLVSGRFLIEQKISISDFYLKRARRLLYPLLGWSLFYGLFVLVGQWQLKENFDPSKVMVSFIQGQPYYHLWFLFLLIGLYSFTPFLHLLRDQISLTSFHRFGWTMLLFGCLNTFYLTYFEVGKSWFPLWFVDYLGFYVLGYTWPKVDQKKNTWSPMLMYVLSGVVIAVSIPYTWQKWGSVYFYNYLSFLVIIGALAIYAVFCRVELRDTLWSKIASYSFGIFLLHPFFLTLINKSPLGNHIPGLESAWTGIFIKFVLVFFFAAIGTYLLRLNKFTARFV